MAALCENVLAVNMLLSVFFLPSDLADCLNPVLFADTPGRIETLSGSCLQIPCRFNSTDSTYDKKRTIYGVWLRSTTDLNANPNPVIFNSSGSVNIYSLKMIGNLTEENCTTLFPDLNTSHADTYFIRIQNWPFMATAACEPVQITVRDSPWRPSINIPADLKEHQSVTISCSALTPCPHSPPELTWSLQEDSHRQTEKNTEGTFTTKIQETITLSDTHDGYNISCSATYPVNGGNKTAETEVTLSVSYAPKDTSASISPSGLVSAGSWVELSCSSRAKPPASFTWFRNNTEGEVFVGNILKFRAIKGGEYYCMAINDLGNETSSVIYFTVRGLLYGPLYWGTIPVGCLVFACLFAILWCFNSKHSAPQLTQSQRSDVQMSVKKQEEEFYYGEITFGKKNPETSSVMVHDNEEQETVYTEVKLTKPENNSTQTTESPEDQRNQEKKE